ncbi:hypothetical protein DEU56DRAFT_787923 [Suillus clintonianus]|uniref:uncharacterized protein n=1 Tax=Suillus clintonianus TaxID=1904413 RepID=UPI001B867194|nr:uncharacterized protein DEU56DRAFT_787923 [Suillus clintonianus]KAG2145775.1 hypothetical protein DEU56DRAFT_787923 [Suillus clintonianus]
MHPSSQHLNRFPIVQMNPATRKRVADDLEDNEVREVKRVKMGSSAIWNDADFTPEPGFDKFGRQKFKHSFDREIILPGSYVGHIRSQKHKDAKENPVRSPTWATANVVDPIVHPVSSLCQSPEAMVTETTQHLDLDSPFKDVEDKEFVAWLFAPDPDEQSQETASSPDPATHGPSSPQLPEVMVTEAAEDLDLSSTFTETEDLNLDHSLDMGIGADLPLESDIIDITAASMSSDFMTTNVPILPPADEVSLSSEEGPFAGLPAYLLSIPRDVLEGLPFFITEVPPTSTSSSSISLYDEI